LPWTPSPAPPLTGALAPNTALDEVHRWEIPGGLGPEDVAVDDAGRVYAGLRDGRVLRWSGDGTGPEVVVDTHAGPAGLEFDPQGRLVICDMLRGLLRADAAGEVQVLADSYHGRRLGMVNNAAIGADGTIYFSDSSTRWPAADYRRDLLEHRPTGRLFARRPDGRLDLLLDDLAFANGVSLGPDEDYLLIAETGRYRVLRYELTGPAAGTARVVTDNLPGFPDNLSARGDGTYWLGLPSPRLPMLDCPCSTGCCPTRGCEPRWGAGPSGYSPPRPDTGCWSCSTARGGCSTPCTARRGGSSRRRARWKPTAGSTSAAWRRRLWGGSERRGRRDAEAGRPTVSGCRGGSLDEPRRGWARAGALPCFATCYPYSGWRFTSQPLTGRDDQRTPGPWDLRPLSRVPGTE
jgi:sugar lactone lactonase YvrE